MNTTTLHDYLTRKLEQKRKEHPSFRLMEIDDRLFPNAQTKHSTLVLEARNSNDELKTVAEIVAESWGKGDKNHLMIEGEGGIGKTVTLLSIPDKFTPFPVPAIYIPLHELPQGDDPIERYIKKRVLSNKEDLYGQLFDLLEKPWDKGPQLLLLLDGFNEIASEKRPTISEDIKYWSEFQGIQIVTSSRYDIHTYVSLSYDYSTIKLQPLSDRTVEEYLNSTGVPIPVDNSAKKLITIPLLLTLYVQTALILEQRETDSSSFKEVKNAGSIVWNYLQCELWRFGIEDEDAKNAIIAMEFIAPYMAWQMQQNSLFFLNQEQFNKFLEDAYKLLKSHFDKLTDFQFHIQDALQKADGIPPLKLIRSLLEKHLCLFVKNGEQYRLMHQQFRDALAAIHLINLSYLSDNSLPQEWNTPIDYYVMQFVADLISDTEANRLWEQNRKMTPSIENATRNQLELQKRLRNSDFSGLDFSGLNLSDISLYLYRTNNATIKLPTLSERMDKTKLSEKTFTAEGHKRGINAVSITPNGEFIVSGSSDQTIRIWNLYTGELVRTLEGHHGSVSAIGITSNGKFIISGSQDQTIRVWDLEIGKPIRVLNGKGIMEETVSLTPNGKYILSGTKGKSINVWDLETGELTGVLEGHEYWVNTIAVAPNGKFIVRGANKTIRIIDLKTGDHIRTLRGHKASVNVVAITPNGKFVVSGLNDSTICIWDIETGKLKRTLEGHEEKVIAVAITPNGKYVVSGSQDQTIRVWDLEKGEFMKILKGHKGSVNTIAVAPNGKLIISGSDDNSIRIWDIETGELIRALEEKKVTVRSVVVTPDGKFGISGSWENTIRIWDLEANKLVRTLDEHICWVNAITVTLDGKYIVGGTFHNTIHIWDLETGELTRILEGHEGLIHAITIEPNGKYVVSGSSDRTVRIWDLETGELTRILEGHKNCVNAVAVAPNGKLIASGDLDGAICIWALSSGKLKKVLKKHYGPVSALSITPNGKYVVSGVNNAIHIWDLKCGEHIKAIEGHKSGVKAITVTQSGKYVIIGSYDGTVCIQNLETGIQFGRPIKRHNSIVYAVAVDSNDKFIISGSWDGTICINNINTREAQTIQILPLSLVGLDLSKAIFSTPELKETLRQNGAKVDPD